MDRASRWLILAGVALLTPKLVSAQVALPANPEKEALVQNEVGGKMSFESLRASAQRPSIPLRYGQVKKGSETVQTEGKTLVRDQDYYVDYLSGVLYFKIPVRDGQVVTVNYRYDEATGTQGTFGLNSTGSKFQGFTFQMNKNTSMILGMGLTERLGDGTVLSSNVYGMANSFKFGSGSIKGLYMVGDRQKVETNNLFGDQKKTQSDVEEGRSEAIVQRVETGLLGGKIHLDYQDIGEKFGGFSAFEGSGFDQKQVQQFAKEKGLKRTGFTADGIGGKGLNLRMGMASIGDDQGAISWRSYGGNLLGLDVSWSDTKVDPGFTKFNNIAEDDRAQLAKERGLERQSLGLAKAWKGGGLKFDSSKVEGLDGFGFYRRGFSFAQPWLQASFSDQQVQQGFSRFNDLREADRGQLAREGGLVRQNMAFALTPKSGPQLNWSDSVVRTDTGDLTAIDFGLKFGALNFSHSRLEAASGFTALGNLAPAEIGNNLTSIVHMVDPSAKVQGADNGAWARSAGLNRSNWRLDYNLGKGGALGAAAQTIEGATDDLQVRQYSLKTNKFSASFRDQDTGKDFSEAGQLLPTEQQNLGTALGVHKTDFSLNANLSGLKKISFDQMKANDENGGLVRQSFGFFDKGFNINYTKRSVDEKFAGLPGLVDPEKNLLSTMVGFDQTEFTGGWQLLKNLGVHFRDSKAFNTTSGLGRFSSSASFKWKPDKLTQFEANTSTEKQTDPTQPLIDQTLDSATLSRDLGGLGHLTLTEEHKTFDGSQDSNPDATRQSMVYENQLTKSTSLRTEHSLTRYENGEHETTTSNSLSQALTPRVGISVTDTKVEREGDKPDETHRDYGFWVDFGKNIRLNYKAVRNMKGEAEGTLHNEVGVTPGEVQGVNIGAASYQSNGWDDKRDQHIGNVSISNVKPMRLGFLQDVRFNYAVDSFRDMDAWQKEYRTIGFGARIGAFAFGLDYKSQSLPAGDRAIDRVFAFTTDVSGKSWLRADVKYNLRTLPYGEQVMVRNFTLTAEPVKHWQVTHSVMTNPLQADNNAMLGANATPTRSNKWAVNFDGNPNTKFGLGYEEFFNEQNNQQVSSLKVGTTLFANNPSPLVLEYIMAESNATGTMQRSHGFNFGYVQRPGPNQSLSFRLSNLNWELAHPEDQNLQNWNLRLDYSWKF